MTTRNARLHFGGLQHDASGNCVKTGEVPRGKVWGLLDGRGDHFVHGVPGAQAPHVRPGADGGDRRGRAALLRLQRAPTAHYRRPIAQVSSCANYNKSECCYVCVRGLTSLRCVPNPYSIALSCDYIVAYCVACRRLLCLTERCLVERDPATYCITSLKPLTDIFAIVRDQADPQLFTVEFVRGLPRHYNSTERCVRLRVRTSMYILDKCTRFASFPAYYLLATHSSPRCSTPCARPATATCASRCRARGAACASARSRGPSRRRSRASTFAGSRRRRWASRSQTCSSDSTSTFPIPVWRSSAPPVTPRTQYSELITQYSTSA